MGNKNLSADILQISAKLSKIMTSEKPEIYAHVEKPFVKEVK